MVGTMIPDHLIGMQNIGTDLAAPFRFCIFTAQDRPFFLLFSLLQFEQPRPQNPHGELTVLGLRTLVLAGDDNTRWKMRDAYGCRIFLHVLPARARRAEDIHL